MSLPEMKKIYYASIKETEIMKNAPEEMILEFLQELEKTEHVIFATSLEDLKNRLHNE